MNTITQDNPTRTSEEERLRSNVEVEVFYDGDCPLCRREINLLQRWDKKDRIRFTNIASPDFSPVDLNLTHDQMMAEIYGRLPDGELIKGVEVFRRLYSAVGFGPLVAISRLPILSHILRFGYSVFARNRLKLTGRCTKDSCEL